MATDNFFSAPNVCNYIFCTNKQMKSIFVPLIKSFCKSRSAPVFWNTVYMHSYTAADLLSGQPNAAEIEYFLPLYTLHHL